MDKLIKTEFIESASVGYAQIRIAMPNGQKETYFQELKKPEAWFRLSDGMKAPLRLAMFIDERAAYHRNRTKERIASLDRLVHG